MLENTDLETEAERLAAQLRGARCCDALVPCYRCSLLKYNVLARRRVLEIPRRPVRRTKVAREHAPLALVAAPHAGLELAAS